MTLSKKQKKYLISISMAFIIMALIIVFIINPTIVKIKKINNEIIEQQIKLQKKLDQGLNIQKTKKELAEIGNSTENLKSITVIKNKELFFITTLENLAASQDVDLKIESSFSGKKISDYIEQVDLQMNIFGSWPAVVNFLTKVETLPEYYNLDSIFISKNANQQNPGVNLQLAGKIYVKTETEN